MSVTYARGMRLSQLRDRIRAEGGIWDDERALNTYWEIGFNCTIERARVNLRMVAERFPGLLTAAEGRPSVWQAVPPT